MNILSIILKEIRHRAVNAALAALAVTAAVGFFVFFLTTGEASKRETARIMRDIGYNIRILPAETDMDQYWLAGYSEHTMPEEYALRFAEIEGYSYAHILATLQRKVAWRGMGLLLTGISAEIAPPDHQKPSMIFTIEPGHAYVGHEVAAQLGLERGAEAEILGKTFKIERVLGEAGSADDIRVYAHLSDVQAALGLEGRVNEIKALDCMCLIEDPDPMGALRDELRRILPEAKMFHMRDIASARENQRQMTENYFALLIPLVTAVCALWIGALAFLNVRERRTEIGILRALGHGSGAVAALFMGKAVLLGLGGALIGFALGTGLALSAGADIFEITAKNIKPMYGLLGWSIVIAPVFAALSSFIPAMIAVTQDPADTLRDM